jgi:hypothetical protein
MGDSGYELKFQIVDRECILSTPQEHISMSEASLEILTQFLFDRIDGSTCTLKLKPDELHV